MAKFNLKKLGVKPKDIMEFPQGLIGFSSAKRFVLLDEPSSKRFMWLASVDRPDLSFLVARAEDIVADYNVGAAAERSDSFGLGSAGAAEVFLIVTVPKNPVEATANLRSPVLINTKTKQGLQIVLDEPNYPVQYPILEEHASVKSGSTWPPATSRVPSTCNEIPTG